MKAALATHLTMKLQGKVAIVVGAAGGMERASAVSLRSNGRATCVEGICLGESLQRIPAHLDNCLISLA